MEGEYVGCKTYCCMEATDETNLYAIFHLRHILYYDSKHAI